MGFGKDALALKSGGDRRLEPLGERQQLGRGSLGAEAGVQERLGSRIGQKLRRGADLFGARPGRRFLLGCPEGFRADLMARDPLITAPDAPIESAARLMRDRKIGALPVVSDGILVGLITESDIFRALVEVFEARDRAVRITFSLKPGEDILPLVAEIARRRGLRVTSFMALSHHEPPLCVVQLAGAKLDEALDDVWKSQHRVMNVVQPQKVQSCAQKGMWT